MKIRIRTADFRLSVPVPTAWAGVAIRLIPNRVFKALEADVPAPYRELVSKESIQMILRACLDILRENRGLEVIHVEAADGTYVSIRL